MDERDIAVVAVMLPMAIIVGGVVVMVWGIRHATRQAELQHEERMAMIERGMTPPELVDRGERVRRAHGFKMSFGILLCGLGLGLLMLITFAVGEAGIGFGVGGAVIAVGLAFVVSAMFTERHGPSLEERMTARRAGLRGGMPPGLPFDPAAPPRPAPLDPPPAE
jgi:MFS family permease